MVLSSFLAPQSHFPSKEFVMLSSVRRLVFTVVLPAGLALLLCTQAAHAQRRGTLQQNGRGFGQGQGRCGGGQTGTQSQMFTPQPQLSTLSVQYYPQLPLSNSATQVSQQALATALQQQAMLNAVQQYIYEAQLTGTDPNEALQAALLAIQMNGARQNRR
jgi:hypothetical protein